MTMKMLPVLALVAVCQLASAATDPAQELDLAAPERAAAGTTWSADAESNYAAVVQSGSGNFASIVQNGSGNRASIEQANVADWAVIVQTGANNVARIRQGAR